jgi:hypothetical protein
VYKFADIFWTKIKVLPMLTANESETRRQRFLGQLEFSSLLGRIALFAEGDDDGSGGGEAGDHGGGGNGNTDREPAEHEAPEKGLGGDKYVKELDRMDREFGDWMKDHGYDMASGGRGSDTNDRDRGTEYHLLDGEDARTSPFGLGVDTSRLAEHTEWIDLAAFAYGQGFTVTATTSSGTGHNRGSLHYVGRAIDVRTSDMSEEEINSFIDAAQRAGIHVRDERERPAGQAVWDGPHLHLSVPDHWREPSDRMPHDSIDRSGGGFAPRNDSIDIRRP